ncbi:hypothetical protein ABRZ24_13930 [Brenneria populi]|uniref:Uncharacterized protein n=1 Tax=Brenneria populi TaxID=1505588 RepID=A0ABU6JSI8_9GAMM|nr:hypothetical protein [Brenneria populi Li et al. 2015]
MYIDLTDKAENGVSLKNGIYNRKNTAEKSLTICKKSGININWIIKKAMRGKAMRGKIGTKKNPS